MELGTIEKENGQAKCLVSCIHGLKKCKEIKK